MSHFGRKKLSEQGYGSRAPAGLLSFLDGRKPAFDEYVGMLLVKFGEKQVGRPTRRAMRRLISTRFGELFLTTTVVPSKRTPPPFATLYLLRLAHIFNTPHIKSCCV